MRLGSRGRYDHLDEIRTLDPYDDADRDRIVTLTGRYDFPWDWDQGTAIAFLRDYGVPTIARLLDRDPGVRGPRRQAVRRHPVLPGGGDRRGRRVRAVQHRGSAAEPDPRPLRHPQRRVPVRPGHHARRPGALDQPLRLARPRPGRAGGADPVHHPVRRADGDQGAAGDLRRLPRAADLLRARAVRVRPGQQAGHRGHHPDRPGDRAVVPQARLPARDDRADGRAAADRARHGGAAPLAGPLRSTSGCGCGRRRCGSSRPAPRRTSGRTRRTRTATSSAGSARPRCSTS